MEWFDLLAVQGTLKSLLQHHSSKASILQHSAFFISPTLTSVDFPSSTVGKESACHAGDPCLIPGSGRSAGEGIGYPLQFSWAFLVAQLVKNPPACRSPGFNPWVGKTPWRREQLPTPVFWPGEFHGLYSPWGRKESDTTERLSLSHLYLTTEKTTALTVWTLVDKVMSLFLIHSWVCPSSFQGASFNFITTVTVFSGFRAQENKICPCFYFFSFCLP